MQYVPYEAIGQQPNIIVDGSGTPSTVLVLSHWPHSGTPREFKADTSTEIVLNYLRSPRRAEYGAKAQVVSNNHFDEDGLMSVWAMLNPEEALSLREQLVAVATAGDFSRVLTPEAAQIAFAINKLAGGVKDGDKYAALLPQVGDLIRQPARYETLWRQDWQRLEADLGLIDGGAVTITEYPQIDLAVVEAPRPVENMALCSRTDRLRVLTIFGQGFYQLQYRYESWVQVVSRTVRPRIDLYPLADRLQQLETAQGRWRHGDTTDITPGLQFEDFDGTPIPSALPGATVIAEVIGFFEREQDNPALQWGPYDEGEEPSCGTVFSHGGDNAGDGAEPPQPVLYSLGGPRTTRRDEPNKG